jgi:hypothetical protein
MQIALIGWALARYVVEVHSVDTPGAKSQPIRHRVASPYRPILQNRHPV